VRVNGTAVTRKVKINFVEMGVRRQSSREKTHHEAPLPDRAFIDLKTRIRQKKSVNKNCLILANIPIKFSMDV
jgi:hypothetical protein